MATESKVSYLPMSEWTKKRIHFLQKKRQLPSCGLKIVAGYN
jgi:hypothetical protein